MPALFLYLLKVNAALVLFYLAYRFLLRPLTFYTLNRFFLVFSIVFSLAYPVIDVSNVLRKQQQLSSRFAAVALDWRAVELLSGQAQVPAFWQVLTVLFWLGVVIMALRFIGQILSLYRIHQQSSPAWHSGFYYRKVDGRVNPFSFWQTAYLNPQKHRQEELTAILRHEHIHVHQWHTLDVLLSEANLVLCWFNPGAWLLKQAVQENLEFFTDRQMLQSGMNSKAYQYSLVRISGLSHAALVNNFNFLTIKKRITMMNKKQSPLMHVVRYAVLVPLIAAPMFAFTACSEEPTAAAPNIIQVQPSVQVKAPAAVVYYIDGKEVTNDAIKKLDSKKIESMNVLKGESAVKAFGDKGGKGVIVITTKKNQHSTQVRQFNEKLKGTQ